MQHQTNYVLTSYIWFVSKLEIGNEMFYFIENHYNDFVHNFFALQPCINLWQILYRNWKMVHYIVAIQNFLNSWSFSIWKFSNLTTIKT